jgi:parallel beta-helix repeat protein
MTRRRSPTRTRPGVARAAIAAGAAAGFLALSSGPAAAHGVSCGDTITRDTTLHGNLTNCPGDGLVIGAGDITLDLNGYTIDGDKTGAPDCELTATGVSNPAGHDGVTVENGTVREFGQGIDGGFGRSLLRNLTVRDNRGHGIGFGAFAPDSVDDNWIRHNLVAGNGCGAVSVTGANRIRIAGNRFEDGGVALIGVSDAVVERNSASGGGGIFGFDVRHSRIEHNAVSHSVDGIFLYFSNDNQVSENASWANHFSGISLKASSNNLVSGNSTWDNPGGIGLEAEEGLADRSNDNTVTRNRSSHDGIGVLVLASDRNQIAGNRVSDALVLPGSPIDPLNEGFGISVAGGTAT